MNQNMLRIGVIIAVVVIGGLGVRFGLWDQGAVDSILDMTQSAPEPTASPESSGQPQSAPVVTPAVATLPMDTAPQCGEDLDIEREDFQALFDLGAQVGVRYPATFARVVDHMYDEDRLPNCYMTKDQARDQGWQRGTTMDQAAPGRSIGGDYFGNREGRLPSQYNGDYREADLDYVRGGRGASRLVYVRGRADEGLIWVTTDHYDSFTRVYCGASVCD